MINTFFFHHTALEYAMRNGYDCEQDLTEFWESKKEKLEEACWELPIKEEHQEKWGETITVTEGDVIELSKGIVGESAYRMFKYYEDHCIMPDFSREALKKRGPTPPPPVVLQSMHSGSSAYLTVKDIYDAVDAYENKDKKS